LVRKLLEDLHNGDKIFLYKATFGITEPEMALVLQSLLQYGGNRLLCVLEAD